MVRYLIFILFVLVSSVSQATECSEDSQIIDLMSPCHKAYYRFAPNCDLGDGLCLSLALQGLMSKNLFDYRSSLRRSYNTPLKRKKFRQTDEYKRHYSSMIADLKELSDFTFCAEMDSYWLYDLSHKGFGFLPHSIIPKGRLYRLKNVKRIAGYDFIFSTENTAVDIESWENIAGSKYAFFNIKGTFKGYVPIHLTRFIWLIPTLQSEYEGSFGVSYEEGCRYPSFFEYRVLQ